MKPIHIKHIISFAALIAATYYGCIEKVQWCRNIVAALMVMSALHYMAVLLPKKKDEHYQRLLQTYIDGRHLPKIVDELLYTALFLMAAGSGSWFLFILINLTAGGDFMMRDRAKEAQKEAAKS